MPIRVSPAEEDERKEKERGLQAGMQPDQSVLLIPLVSFFFTLLGDIFTSFREKNLIVSELISCLSRLTAFTFYLKDQISKQNRNTTDK